MQERESLNHAKWYCKYHKECRIEEGHLLEDHEHMLISIPPKLAVASVIGFIKGKSAIYIARNFSGRRKISRGKTFGRAVTMFQPLALMRTQCVSTSSIRKKKTNG
jgi:REP element-mobilizing transposase RayT